MYLIKGWLCYLFVTFFSFSFANDDEDVCGDLPVIPHATIDNQGKEAPFDLGFRTRIRCVEGYITGGKLLYLKCAKKEEAAVWQYSENPCKPRSCGFPGQVENAIRIGHVFTFPSNVTFVCNEGFKMKGTSTVSCAHTGQWGTSFPTCEEITCPPLSYPENGKVKYRSSHYGNTATYECNRGFTLEGLNLRICGEDSQWSGEVPLCRAKTCSSPLALANGIVLNMKDTYYYGDLIIFLCGTGERRPSRCLAFGIWSADPPFCPGPALTSTIKIEPLSSPSPTRIIKTETPSTPSATSTVKSESSSTSSPAVDNTTEPSRSSTAGIVKTGATSPSPMTVETEASSASSPTGNTTIEHASTPLRTAKPEVSSTSSTTSIVKTEPASTSSSSGTVETGPISTSVYCPMEITTASDGAGSKFTWPKTLHGTEAFSMPPCIKENSRPFLRNCLKNTSGGDAYWEKLDGVCSKQNFPYVLGNNCTVSEEHQFAVEIITYIGCGFSILALALIVLTFLFYRQWREENKNKILFNLCAALIVALVIYLVCFGRSHSGVGSRIAAALLHYFLLATFAWMLVEALVHYLIVVKNRLNAIRRIIIISMVCAWGAPLLTVSLLLVVYPSAYDEFKNSCWDSSAAFSYALALPVGSMLIITFVMLFLILRSLSCGPHGSNNYPMNEKQQHIKRLQTSICILVLLGLSCIFGFLAVDETRPVFQSLFAVTITLEGLFIFVNSILRERTSLELWKDLLFRSRRNRVSPINDCKVSMLEIMKERNA